MKKNHNHPLTWEKSRFYYVHIFLASFIKFITIHSNSPMLQILVTLVATAVAAVLR